MVWTLLMMTEEGGGVGDADGGNGGDDCKAADKSVGVCV